jgi:hypothetical protein
MTQEIEAVNKRVTEMIEALMEYRKQVKKTAKTGEESAILA